MTGVLIKSGQNARISAPVAAMVANMTHRMSTAATLALLLAGCATVENYEMAIRSWEGAPATEMLEVWGEPDRVRDLSNLQPSLGQSIAYFEWVSANRTEAEHALLEAESEHCSGMESEAGALDAKCVEKTLFPEPSRLFCKTTAKVVDGYIDSVTAEGNACAATDEYAQKYRRSH